MSPVPDNPLEAVGVDVLIVVAARRLGMELEVVDVPSKTAHELCAAPLALVRPDKVVAWRGSGDAEADAVVPAALGQA